MESQHFDCACSDFGHIIRFDFDPQDGDVYLTVHLSYWEPWWKRVWKAFKYVFKRGTPYGNYDVTLLREDDYDRLRDLLARSEIAKAGALSRVREQRHER